MTAPFLFESAAYQPPAFPEVEFGRSADGFAVARVADSALAMLPGHDGRHYLAYGWRIGRPLAKWRRSDFYGHSGDLTSEEAFRAKVGENAEHQRERKALGRVEEYSRAHTPWGASQGATIYAEGVVSHSTAGHGGFKLSAARNRHVQARRVANFILAWWNADSLGGFDLADIRAVDRDIARSMAIVVARLAEALAAEYPEAYRAEIENLIRLWRPEVWAHSVEA